MSTLTQSTFCVLPAEDVLSDRLCWSLELNWEISKCSAPGFLSLRTFSLWGSQNSVKGRRSYAFQSVQQHPQLQGAKMTAALPYPAMTTKNVLRCCLQSLRWGGGGWVGKGGQQNSCFPLLHPLLHPADTYLRSQLTCHLQGPTTPWVMFCGCHSLRTYEAHNLCLQLPVH